MIEVPRGERLCILHHMVLEFDFASPFPRHHHEGSKVQYFHPHTMCCWMPSQQTSERSSTFLLTQNPIATARGWPSSHQTETKVPLHVSPRYNVVNRVLVSPRAIMFEWCSGEYCTRCETCRRFSCFRPTSSASVARQPCLCRITGSRMRYSIFGQG